MAKWYEKAFDAAYLETYQQFEHVEIWNRDCDFIEKALKLKRGEAVFDLCCGSGRHSVELAQRGYKMTGLDVSGFMIEYARRRATALNVEAEWLHMDAQDLNLASRFDAVFNFLTSFGYCGMKGDLRILRNVKQSLRPGGRLMLELINPIWLMANFVHDQCTQQDDYTYLEKREYDAQTGMITFSRTKEYPSGETVPLEPFRVRAYFPVTLCEMLEETGFKIDGFLGSPTMEDYSPFRTPRMAILSHV